LFGLIIILLRGFKACIKLNVHIVLLIMMLMMLGLKLARGRANIKDAVTVKKFLCFIGKMISAYELDEADKPEDYEGV
jgi:hypothetical protein